MLASAIHQHESAISIHMSPVLNLPLYYRIRKALQARASSTPCPDQPERWWLNFYQHMTGQAFMKLPGFLSFIFWAWLSMYWVLNGGWWMLSHSKIWIQAFCSRSFCTVICSTSCAHPQLGAMLGSRDWPTRLWSSRGLHLQRVSAFLLLTFWTRWFSVVEYLAALLASIH